MNAFKIILFIGAGLLLAACGNSEDEHGHPHDGETAHSPAVEESAAEADTEHGHAHGDDTHAHDAPETEAFYGDDADTDAAADATAG